MILQVLDRDFVFKSTKTLQGEGEDGAPSIHVIIYHVPAQIDKICSENLCQELLQYLIQSKHTVIPVD